MAAEVDVLSSATSDDAATPDELVAQLHTISGSLTAIGTEIETTLGDIAALDGGAELQDAVADNATCQQVGAAG